MDISPGSSWDYKLSRTSLRYSATFQAVKVLQTYPLSCHLDDNKDDGNFEDNNHAFGEILTSYTKFAIQEVKTNKPKKRVRNNIINQLAKPTRKKDVVENITEPKVGKKDLVMEYGRENITMMG